MLNMTDTLNGCAHAVVILATACFCFSAVITLFVGVLTIGKWAF